MKLYYSPAACSLAPHIALEACGLKYEAIKVNLANKKMENGDDFTKINPKGYVPTIEVGDGKILTEAAVILQYISDQASEKEFLPKLGTWARYQANEWLNYVATEMHKGFGAYWGINKLVTNPEGNAEWRKNNYLNMQKKFDYLSEHLKNNKFMLGQNFSAVDAYLFTIINWSHPLKFDMAPWPTLLGYMENVKMQPAVMATLKAEGLA